MIKLTSKFVVAVLVLLATISLKAIGQSTVSAKYTDQTKREIITAMDNAALAWNKGDLDGYNALYDPAATMMMKGGRVGLDSIRKIYVKYYFDGNRPKQELYYSNYELTMLGNDYALLTGEFILKANGKLTEKKGIFSLIFVHKNKLWLLLHDHSG